MHQRKIFSLLQSLAGDGSHMCLCPVLTQVEGQLIHAIRGRPIQALLGSGAAAVEIGGPGVKRQVSNLIVRDDQLACDWSLGMAFAQLAQICQCGAQIFDIQRNRANLAPAPGGTLQ